MHIVCHMMSSIDGRSLTDNWNLDFASPTYPCSAQSCRASANACASGSGTPSSSEDSAFSRTLVNVACRGCSAP